MTHQTLEQQSLESLFGQFWASLRPNKIIDDAGSFHFFEDDLGRLQIAEGTTDVSVVAVGDVSNLQLEEFADGFHGQFYSDVGRIDVDNAWYGNIAVFGDVDTVSISDVHDVSLRIAGQTARVELEDSSFTRVNLRNFQDGRLDAEDVVDLGLTVLNAHGADFEFSEVSDGSAFLDGDRMTMEIEDSAVDSLTIVGGQNYLNVEDSIIDRLAIFGEGNDVFLEDATVNDLTLQGENILQVEDSFVAGSLGYGSSAYLEDSRSILELQGENRFEQSGGQSILDAANGAVDHFVFTEGARSDGSFDSFDQFELASGAIWTAAELSESDDDQVVDLPNGSTIALYIESDAYMFG